MGVAVAVLSTIGGTTHAAIDSERLIQAMTDPASGVSVRIARAATGDLIITVANDVVSIRKQAAKERLMTTVQTKTERISLTTDAKGLKWENANDRMTVHWSQPDSLALIQRAASSSPAITAAIAMLGRVTLKQDSPLGHVILTMRSMLQTTVGDTNGRVALAEWAHQAQRALHVVPVVFTPKPDNNKCWDEYAIDAVRIWDDFQDCENSCSWWNFLGKEACVFMYEMRAIATFAEFEVCVASGSSS